ncbi:MAG: fumarylacetoacetate hydrolase family protein [Candidatus Sumerlaeaceae bacterium]|nr:fumarylacetoacetate hydrolase family protein [Candidatus Sumerlaeaceae bacterium]
MKLARYLANQEPPRLGFVKDERIYDVEHLLRVMGYEVDAPILNADIFAMAADFERWGDSIRHAFESGCASGLVKSVPQYSVDSVRILPPIPRPTKFICVGLNYRDHCEEQNLEPPKTPVIFAKFANAICGHKDLVKRPSITAKLDFEGELGVVIGRGGKKIPAERALAHVLGYLIVNDISARDIQKSDGQWLRAKSMDTFAPTGPWITTTDEIADPRP